MPGTASAAPGNPFLPLCEFSGRANGAAGYLDGTTSGIEPTRSYTEQRAMLGRMENARAETERHLLIIESQIVAKAERITITVRTKSRHFGRNTTTCADERGFQENVAAIRFERRCELDTLTRKLARQTGAIAALCVRYRIDQELEEAGL